MEVCNSIFMNTRFVIFLGLMVIGSALLPQSTYAATGSADLKVNGSDAALSFSGKTRVTLSWVGTGVKNCGIYVAGGRNLKVRSEGTKKMQLPSDAAYVSFNCNSLETGEALSDKILITDPKGTSSLSTITDDTQTITAIATGRLVTQICIGDFFGTLNWGDGKTDKVGPEFKNQHCGTEASDTQTHYYTQAGIYTVTFKDWIGRKHKEKVKIR